MRLIKQHSPISSDSYLRTAAITSEPGFLPVTGPACSPVVESLGMIESVRHARQAANGALS
jgi:hypothetical protein